MKPPSLITALLGIAAVGFFNGASVNTIAWTRCTQHQGGKACQELQVSASASWTNFGTLFLALVTNVIREQAS